MKSRLAFAGAAAVLAAATLVYLTMRTQETEPPSSTVLVEPPAADGKLVGAAPEGPATEAMRVAVESENGVPAVAGTNVLRVILEGITAESARTAKVRVAAVDKGEDRASKIRDSWPCQGSTSKFDLDPLLADVAERGESANVDEVEVEVDHPLYLRARTRVSLARDATPTNGKTVYEARLKLVQPEYRPEFSLAVRDAHTRAHLEDIELRAKQSDFMVLWGFGERNHPRTLLGDSLRSPIALMGGRDAGEPEAAVAHMGLRPAVGESPRLVKLDFHVPPGRATVIVARAPGYAQGSIVLDLSKSEERELLLKPGSAIDVRLTNVQLDRYRALATEPKLCVYSIQKNGGMGYVHFAPLDETLATDGLQLDGLRPGGYRVTVELGGGSWTKRPELARAELSEEFALLAGETRKLALALKDPPDAPKRATLGGVVSIPAFGGEENVRLQLYFQPTQRWRKPDVEFSLKDLRRGGGALPSWSFRVEDLPVGMYRVQLLPFLQAWMIELPADGKDDVELVIPELAEVTVETVDGQTGKRVPLDELHYRREKLPGQRQIDRARAETVEPGRFRFWTAPGPTTIWPRGQGARGYGLAWRDLELIPGRQSVRFELSPACCIHFDIRVDGGEPRLSDGIWNWIHYGTIGCVRAVDHEGRSHGRAGKQVTEVSAPGVYEIKFEGLTKDLFHAIPPRLVTVRAGEPTEVIVELRRK